MPSPLRGGWESQNLYEPTFHIISRKLYFPGWEDGGVHSVNLMRFRIPMETKLWTALEEGGGSRVG